MPDEMIELLPLIPFLPKGAIARMADAAFGFSTDFPVSCSNMGDLPRRCCGWTAPTRSTCASGR